MYTHATCVKIEKYPLFQSKTIQIYKCVTNWKVFDKKWYALSGSVCCGGIIVYGFKTWKRTTLMILLKNRVNSNSTTKIQNSTRNWHKFVAMQINLSCSKTEEVNPTLNQPAMKEYNFNQNWLELRIESVEGKIV